MKKRKSGKKPKWEVLVFTDVEAWSLAGKRARYRPVTLSEKLGYLVEECGEVLSAVGKTQRWGPRSSNPELANGEKNREWLLRELDDLELAIGIVRRAMKGKRS